MNSRFWLSNLLLFAGLGFVEPLLPVYFSISRLGASEIGLIFSATAICSCLLTLYIGRLSDIYGRRVVIITCTVGSGATVLLYPFFRSFAELLVVTILFMMLILTAQTISAAASMDLSERLSYGRIFGRFRIAGGLGWILSTAAGGIVASALGIEFAFYASAITIMVSATLALVSSVEFSFSGDTLNLSQVASLVRGRQLGVLFTALTLAYVAQSTFTYFLPLYLSQHFAAPDWLVTLSFTIMGIAEIPAMLMLGSISDRVGRKIILQLCLLLFPVRLVLTAVLPTAVDVTLIQALHGMTFGGLYVVSVAYICDIVPENIRGISFGIFPAAQSLGSIVGAYTGGILISNFGFTLMFLVMAAYSLIPLALLSVFGRETIVRRGLFSRKT